MLSVKLAIVFRLLEITQGDNWSVFYGVEGKIREKTDNSQENWKDLTPEGRKLLEKVAGQLVRKQGTEKWAPAMQRMGLAAPPRGDNGWEHSGCGFPGGGGARK
jgi:hypothetical protein